MAAKPGKRRAGGFGELSFHIGRAYYDHIRLLERILEEEGLEDVLCPGMGQILFALFEHDGCIIKDLKDNLRLAPSHLTRMLERMEGAGVIARRPDARDRRATRVRLTPFGRSLEEKCRAVLAKLNRVMSARMTPGGVQAMKRDLDKIVRNIRAYMSPDDTKRRRKSP
ncbi:MAG: MarR family transcriptional regulator [Kiritimatiellae bacterium]|nr:MarR family transcriptional regulator [Kiritimatiellia bacterium]